MPDFASVGWGPMIDLEWQGSRPMICVAVTYIIKAGHEGRAVELFRELTGPTRGEPGCRMWLFRF